MNARFILTEAACGPTAYIFEDEVLSEVHPFSDEAETGSIYVAVVDNIVENLKAAFLRIENDEILYYSLEENEGKHIFIKHGNKTKVRKGDWLLVQKIKAAKGSKKGQATADVSLKGKYAVINRSGRLGISKRVTSDEKREGYKAFYDRLKDDYPEELTDDYGIIIRSAAISAENSEVIEKDTINTLRKLRDIVSRAFTSTAGCCIYRSKADISTYIMDVRSKCIYDKLQVITDIKEVYDDLQEAGFCGAAENQNSGREECNRISRGAVGNQNAAGAAGNQDVGKTSGDRYCGGTIAELDFYKEKLQSLAALYNINRTVSVMFGRKIYLKSGGYLVVDLTEALTVIDVNTGKDIKGSNLSEHILKTNNEAAEMIARILRIRNLSGIIIVDFINMKDAASEEKAINCLKEHISKDGRKCFFVDMTELGLAELTRQRIGTSYDLENILINTNNK